MRTRHIARGIRIFTRLGFDQLRELLQIGGFDLGVHSNQHRRRGHQTQWREVLGEVKGELGDQDLVDDVGVGCEQKGVAVGWGPEHRFCTDGATCASLVVHHHARLPKRGELLSKDACSHVCSPTWREGHHQFDRTIGKVAWLVLCFNIDRP